MRVGFYFRVAFVIAVLCLAVTLLVVAILLRSQAGPLKVAWDRTYGSSSFEVGWSVVRCRDGGFLVAGDAYDSSISHSDVYLVKIDDQGAKIWERMYGGDGFDRARAIVGCRDGGYLVAGDTSSFGAGSSDIYLLRINEDGWLVWNKTYGGREVERFGGIVRAQEGQFIVAGSTSSFGALEEAYFFCIDEDGNIIWNRTVRAGKSWLVHCIAPTLDGGCVAAGMAGPDLHLVRINRTGDPVWQRRYDFTFMVSRIAGTEDGGFLVVCNIYDGSEGRILIYALRIDAEGDAIWNRSYGSDLDLWADAVMPSGDGGFLLGGGIVLRESAEDLYILKVDRYGSKVWEKAYGGRSRDSIHALTGSKDEIIAAGLTDSSGSGKTDVHVVRFVPNPST